jgi:hypothetical protein
MAHGLLSMLAHLACIAAQCRHFRARASMASKQETHSLVLREDGVMAGFEAMSCAWGRDSI